MRKEHPEDKAARIRGEKDGRKHGPAFAKAHANELAALISTYADQKAHDLLDALREQFWTTDFTTDPPTPLRPKPPTSP